jgi:hypothetical protein
MPEIHWSAQEKKYFSVMVLSFYLAGVLLCEIVQCWHGQSLLRGLKDTLVLWTALVLLHCDTRNLCPVCWNSASSLATHFSRMRILRENQIEQIRREFLHCDTIAS